MARPVAVLCANQAADPPLPVVEAGAAAAPGAPGGPGASWRLEAWSDGRPRRAMSFPGGAWDGDALTEDRDWLHAVHTCVKLVNARAIHVENAAGLLARLALDAHGHRRIRIQRRPRRR